jgi:hypothetical protein
MAQEGCRAIFTWKCDFFVTFFYFSPTSPGLRYGFLKFREFLLELDQNSRKQAKIFFKIPGNDSKLRTILEKIPGMWAKFREIPGIPGEIVTLL